MKSRYCSIAGFAVMAMLATAALAIPEAHQLVYSALDPLSFTVASTLLAMGPLAVPVTSKAMRALQATKATHVSAARAITDKAAGEGRDLSDDEQKAFSALSAKISSANAAIEREQLLIAEESSLGVATLPDGNISVEENAAKDPKRGYLSAGHFLKDIARDNFRGAGENFPRAGYALAGKLHWGVDPMSAAPSTFSNEAAGADGGFVIPPEFSKEFWRLSLGEDALLPLTANVEIGGNSMIFPKDESTPWGGTGVQVRWQAEGGAGTQDKINVSSQAMVLHKLMALAPVTNELVEDGFAVGTYLTPLIADRITYKVNESILFGTGVGQPVGCLTGAVAANNAVAAVLVAKEGGQATLTLDPKNITKMVQSLLVGSLKRSRWIATPDILSPLEALTIGNYPIYLPNQSLSESPYGLLKGRPLMLSEHAAAFTSQSDISLIDFSGYRTITKAGGVQTDTSMHIFFDADATAYRLRFRLNGQPILAQPVSPPKSSTKRSHFVTLQAR